MRIVHMSRYIEIPCKNRQYYALGELPFSDVLVAYYANKKDFHDSVDTKDTYYVLVNQMIYHQALDQGLLFSISNCLLPDITRHVTMSVILACLSRGIKFLSDHRDHGAPRMIDYSTFDHLTPCSMLNFETLHRFTALKSLDISGMPIQRLDSLQPSMYSTIEDLNVKNTMIRDFDLMKFTRLKKLNIENTNVGLTFLRIADHPLNHTLEEIYASGCESLDDMFLLHVTRLQVLDVNECESFDMNPISSRLNRSIRQFPIFSTLRELRMNSTLIKLSTLMLFQSLETLICEDYKITDMTFPPSRETLRSLHCGLSNWNPDVDLSNMSLEELSWKGEEIPFNISASSPNRPIFHSLKELEIVGCHNLTDEIMACFRQLRSLTIINNVNLTLSFLTSDHPLTETIEELKLINTTVEDSALMHLQNLRKLHVTQCGVRLFTLDPATPLFHTMEELDLGPQKIPHNQYNIMKKNVQFLSKFQKLRKLHINRISVGLEFLSPNFVSNDSETFEEDLDRPTNPDLPLHPLCWTLEDLSLMNSDVMGIGIRYLQNLQTLTLSNTMISFDSFTIDDAICWTLKTLYTRTSLLRDDDVAKFQNLRALDTGSDIDMKFLSMDSVHPLCYTLEKVPTSIRHLHANKLPLCRPLNGDR